MLHRVHQGDRPVSPEVQAALRDRENLASLTKREIEVLELVSTGHRNKEIAGHLGIREVTVEVHLRNVFTKLEVHDRTAAVRVAVRRGIIHLE